MTKDELERIKQAYYSGLKVQIWFNGHWENFDARDYSMYSDPFSENRLYRIVGSAYADIAEKRIAELEKEISVLLSCNNCPENKGGYICQKGYEDKCLAQKIQYIKELQEENAELNKKLSKAEADYDKMFWNKNEIISKAKEIIKMLHSDCYSIAECEDTNLGLWEDDLAKAEQFLNNEVEK